MHHIQRVLFIAVALVVCSHARAQSGTVYFNARVYTADRAMPTAEAFAVRGNTIVAVGSRAHVEASLLKASPVAGDTHSIDLSGKVVLPGLIDAHGHMRGLGALQTGVLDLTGTTSYEQVITLVKERAAETPKGEWILGRNWDNESWPDKAMPSHEQLSEAVPDNPVWLSRVDGHAALANRAAMDAADVSPESKDPTGGELLREQSGDLTGVLIDTALDLVNKAVPASARGDGETMLLAAQEACLTAGLTGVHDMGVHPRTAALYRSLDEAGTLKIRIHAACPAEFAVRHFENNEPYRSDRFNYAATKVYIDGAMGSRGAWMLGPYADRPVYETGERAGEAYTGLAVREPGFIEMISSHGLEHGYQVCTHAIGDRGNRETLDAYERASLSTGKPLADARFRVEHAQLISPADIPRFAALGVIASMQPTHCTSDMRWVETRVGAERAKGAYAWKSLLESGAVLAGGSDFPVESHNPFFGFYAAVTRQNQAGSPEGGWFPGERMTRDQALRSMTVSAAYAAFMEDLTGSITPGKRADYIIIDRDIMTCEAREIPTTRVLETVIDGERVYPLD